MPKKSLSKLFFAATRKAAKNPGAGHPPPELATLRKPVRRSVPRSSSDPKSSGDSAAKPTTSSPRVSSQVLFRLKQAAARNTGASLTPEDDSAAEISREISSILRGPHWIWPNSSEMPGSGIEPSWTSMDFVGPRRNSPGSSNSLGPPSSTQPNDVVLANNILDIPWFSNKTDTCRTQRRKSVSRERKQKYIFKNTESRRFMKLMRMCADKLGTESTIEVFGKLGRDAGVKEYNALIELCISKARHSNGEEESLVHIHKAYQLLVSMRERGFQIEERSYGPFLMYMIDMGMTEEFQIFSRLVKDENLGSHSRIGYYEMLLWTRVGDEGKIRELCNSVGVADTEDSYNLAESYLLAFCKSDRKEEFLQLLEVLDITRISSLKYMTSIFNSLGRFQLESFTVKFILALKTTGAWNENISSLICDYAIRIPNLAVEEVVSKFNNLHEKLGVVPSVVSYDKLIRLCCNSFKVHAALDVADFMCQSGLDVPIEIFEKLLHASDQIYEPEMVHPIYSVMRRHNVKPNGVTFKIMISLCMKMKNFEGAYNLLTDAAEMQEVATTSMYNAIMAGYFREKNIHGASMVLKQMEDAGVEPDSETFSYLISNCECEVDIVKHRDEMRRAGLQVTKHVYMALINAYASFGNFEMAKQVLVDQELPTKYLNEIKSVLVSALSSNGQVSDALNVYDEMKKAGCNLEPKAAISLIEHLRSEGELNRLLQLLEELNDSSSWFDGCSRIVLYCVQYNIAKPAVELLHQLKNEDKTSTYIVIDQIFSQIWETEPTQLQYGLELLRAVKEELDLHPSRTSLDFLLSACVKAKDPECAWLIWSEYKTAGLSYNILTFLRMYQALLASGEGMAALKMLENIPVEDRHVGYIIRSCKLTYGKPSSVSRKKR